MVCLCSTPTSSLSSRVFSRKVGHFLEEMGLPYLGRRKGTECPRFTETTECGRAEGSTACSPIRDSKTLLSSWWPDILMQKTAPQGAGWLIMTPSWWGSRPSTAAGLTGGFPQQRDHVVKISRCCVPSPEKHQPGSLDASDNKEATDNSQS